MLCWASEAHLSFKTLLLPLGCGGYAGFFLSLFGEEGCWACSCTISPLCARWDRQSWFHSSQHRFLCMLPTCTCRVPSAPSSSVQTCRLKLCLAEPGSCRAGQPPPVSAAWTRRLRSEACWVPEEHKCTNSTPAPCPSTKAKKLWARPFQRRLSSSAFVQHSWIKMVHDIVGLPEKMK